MIGLASPYTRKVLNCHILPQSPRLPPSRPRANIPELSRAFPIYFKRSPLSSQILTRAYRRYPSYVTFCHAKAQYNTFFPELPQILATDRARVAYRHFTHFSSMSSSCLLTFRNTLVLVTLSSGSISTPLFYLKIFISYHLLFFPFSLSEVRGLTRVLFNYFLFL